MDRLPAWISQLYWYICQDVRAVEISPKVNLEDGCTTLSDSVRASLLSRYLDRTCSLTLSSADLPTGRIWAFLVAVSRYGSDAFKDWPLPGAALDAINIKNYLVKSHHVPDDHIVTLTDEEATRSNIIAKFQEHLINNTDIQYGDAILFHYSGHGSRVRAPEGWAVVREERDLEDKVEVIVPYDASDSDETKDIIPCIPDYTIGALLDQVAKAHGDNITVIFDCCHSSHGTRGDMESANVPEMEGWTTRGLDPSLLSALPINLDEDILGSAMRGEPYENRKERRRGGFTGLGGSKHVLLAACKTTQQAKGSVRGGCFTYFLLQALQDDTRAGQAIAYNSLQSRIVARFEDLRRRGIDLSQDPQFEGPIDRLLFRQGAIDPGFFLVSHLEDRSGEQVCRIEAGEIHRIEEGTILEFYKMDNRLQPGTPLCTTVAREVHSSFCTAVIPDGITFDSKSVYTAVIVQHPYKLTFSVFNDAPESHKAQEVFEVVSGQLQGAPANLVQVPPQSRVQADLTIHVDAVGGIEFRRHDSILGNLKTANPRIAPADVVNANFVHILDAIRLFNANLSLESRKHYFTEKVRLELWKLGEGNSEDVRLLQGGDLFNGGDEAILDAVDPPDCCAFLLHNDSATSLYPFLVYFDPSTYEVSVWCSPFHAEKPTLRAYGSLQLGASPEHHDAFEFYLPDDLDCDTSFIKVFLLDVHVSMKFLNQDPVLGYDQYGQSILKNTSHHRLSGAVTETKGRWDTVVHKVTVRKTHE